MSSGFPIGFLCVGVLLLLAPGVILIKWGFWPRRRGDEPQCRACGYLLIGIESERCPECGAFLSPLAIVHGRRHRRHGLGWTGVVMLLLFAGLVFPYLAGEFDEIDWYHFKPTFWVMRDLRSSAPGVADVAIQELERRDSTGGLSPKYQQQIDEIALAAQATTSQSPLTDELISFLEKQYLAGHLTDLQKARFGQQSISLTLHVRPTVVVGNQVPFVVSENCRVTGSPFWVELTGGDGQAQVDGKAVRGLSGGSSSGAGLGSSGSIGTSLECSIVGKHWFEQSVVVELHTGTFGSNDPKDLVFRQVCKLSGPFEVVAQAPAGDFMVIEDPKLHDLIQSKIKPEQFTIGVHNHSLNGQFQINTAPANLAFDVVAQVGGKQISLGSIVCNKGASTDYGVGGAVGQFSSTSQPVTIDLILRSSEKVARQTVDLHDMWKGELVYHNVLVQSDPKN